MADLAFVSGAIWQQGYYHGYPEAVRSGSGHSEPMSRLVSGKS
jgi:hypothetical protein